MLERIVNLPTPPFEFKMVIIEEVENYILEGTDKTYGKAVSLAKKISDMDPEDYGAKLLYALLCTLTKNVFKYAAPLVGSSKIL